MWVSNAVYFRICVDLMHINPPDTAEGFDGSHHPRYAEWGKVLETIIFVLSHHVFNPNIDKDH